MDRSKWEYKKLEVDNLPIGDVFDIFMGRTPSRDDLSLWEDGSHGWVSIGDMGTTKYISDTKEKVSDKACTNMRLVPKDTVIMSFKLSIGKVAITEIPLYTNEAIMAFPPKSGYNISPNYLYYNLQAYKWQSANRAVMGKTLNKAVISSSRITIPDSETQQRIVAELDCLNEMIALKQEQLKEFDKLAQSIFYDMFGDPVTNEKGWDKSTYGKEFVIGSGGTPSKTVSEYWENGDIPWIGSNMCQNCDIYDNDGKYITQKGLENSSAKVLKDGTVLIALVGATIGKVGLLHKKMATNQNVAYINVWASGLYNSIFVFYHSMKLYQLFLNLGNGGFKMANQGFIKELPIVCPPLALQQQFAEKIQAIEAQKELVKKSIAETQQLLDSRMDYYFN